MENTIYTIHYTNPTLHSCALAQLRIMADADFDAGAYYLCVNRQQLEDLIELELIPAGELTRFQQSRIQP
ncbi:MAG: hypothetical protein COT71_04485 [Candidatus Andersenbacteria bacterium CG10_big_fil_rev_8_21_14_0_10_54_11]|uniref:Uncharacterized protein n=1 Tax=Candidatus Andersenbacteria bacterium CG10_big_fil_rev_8_21_14_0_10_54_11 TaxID=1974485 RepID=A0A2M6WY23_9BACT|nr:MAG: hypothetical protein COT71_04485 [Candidatus Andersenbacteria bacterium CG10_big_fil_rev_8_21_14_0_10_54_11]